MKYTEKLLNDVYALINVHHIPNAEQYIDHVKQFFSYCPNDEIFRLAICLWDEKEQDIDFRWDTKLLDCRFSIGLIEGTWHLWIGENHHKQDDECYQHGMGGSDYEDDTFCYSFYESLEFHIEDIKKDEPYIS